VRTQAETELDATAPLPLVGVDLPESVFQLAVADCNRRIVERDAAPYG
jgi:hypothetical protein